MIILVLLFGSGSCHDYEKKTNNDIYGPLTWTLCCKVVATCNNKGSCSNIIPDRFDGLLLRRDIHALFGFFHGEFHLLYRNILPLVMRNIEKVLLSEYTRTYWKIITNS